jgi:hypothetical protein
MAIKIKNNVGRTGLYKANASALETKPITLVPSL